MKFFWLSLFFLSWGLTAGAWQRESSSPNWVRAETKERLCAVGYTELRGELFPLEGKVNQVLVKIATGDQTLELAANAQIYREGLPCTLAAICPVVGVAHEGYILLDPQGKIAYLEAFYLMAEMRIITASANQLEGMVVSALGVKRESLTFAPAWQLFIGDMPPRPGRPSDYPLLQGDVVLTLNLAGQIKGVHLKKFL